MSWEAWTHWRQLRSEGSEETLRKQEDHPESDPVRASDATFGSFFHALIAVKFVIVVLRVWYVQLPSFYMRPCPAD
jgi:hypothetical protein